MFSHLFSGGVIFRMLLYYNLKVAQPIDLPTITANHQY